MPKLMKIYTIEDKNKVWEIIEINKEGVRFQKDKNRVFIEKMEK